MDNNSVPNNVSLDKALLPDRDNPLLPAQFIPNTGLNIFKIVSTGFLTIPGYSHSTAVNAYGVTSSQTQKAHGLSYVPALTAFVSDDTGGSYTAFPFLNYQSVGSGAFNMQWVNVTVDNTYIYGFSQILGFNQTVALPISARVIKYYLLKESTN